MPHRTTLPFSHSSGPRNAKIALVGEAWGEQEERAGLPFMGASGQLLTSLLSEAGLSRKEIFFTNVFNLRPPNNDIEKLCGQRAEVGKDYPLPPLKMGAYIRGEYLGEVSRLVEELSTVRPHLVVAAGNVACWALLRATKISSIRGAITLSHPGVMKEPLKILPTFHPASVIRNWSQRPIVIADLMKAEREKDFPEIRRPERQIIVNPTVLEVEDWLRQPAAIYGVDVETKRRQIEMIGFARSLSDAIVIPFIDTSRPGNSYWPEAALEVRVRRAVYAALESPVPKVFQNGLYDLQYIVREGCRPRNCLHDTMLLHHSRFPEMPKSLGFLGSIYSNEAAWKLLRHAESNKRDE